MNNITSFKKEFIDYLVKRNIIEQNDEQIIKKLISVIKTDYDVLLLKNTIMKNNCNIILEFLDLNALKYNISLYEQLKEKIFYFTKENNIENRIEEFSKILGDCFLIVDFISEMKNFDFAKNYFEILKFVKDTLDSDYDISTKIEIMAKKYNINKLLFEEYAYDII